MVAVAAHLALTACEHGRVDASAPTEAPEAGERQAAAPTSGASGAPQELRVRVLASFPHDPTVYTQGLLWEPAGLVESAGRYGESLVRRWRPGLKRPQAEQRLDDRYFAEGIALVGETLIQLSWREGIAFYRDRATLREEKRRFYEGEGWGLCYDGEHLIMRASSSCGASPWSRTARRSASSTSSNASTARSTPTSTAPTASRASILRAAA
jgi:glutaminyl-peptide cyclotransferase